MRIIVATGVTAVVFLLSQLPAWSLFYAAAFVGFYAVLDVILPGGDNRP